MEKNKRNRIKAVIFDMDGVMFDTERLSAQLWKELKSCRGYDIGEDFLCRLRGGNASQLKKAFLERFGEDFPFEQVFAEKKERMEELIDGEGVPVKTGLRELLTYLQKEGYRLAVATGSARERVMKNLRSAGVEEYFDSLVCGDEVEMSKPDPAIFWKAAEKLGEEPKNCLVLEDSLNGLRAALAGGFVTVMVPDLTQPDPALRRRVAGVCDSLLEVIPFLEGRKPV